MRPRIPQPAAGVFVCADPGLRGSSPGVIVRLFGAIVLLVSLASYGVPRAQSSVSAAGFVYDAVDGRPVDAALIRLPATEYQALSDGRGAFSLVHIPSGRYRMEITAEGYEPLVSGEIEIVPDITRRLTFHLQRRLYHIKSTEVRTARGQTTIGGLSVVNRDRIRESGATGLAEVLGRVEGLHVMEIERLQDRKVNGYTQIQDIGKGSIQEGDFKIEVFRYGQPGQELTAQPLQILLYMGKGEAFKGYKISEIGWRGGHIGGSTASHTG